MSRFSLFIALLTAQSAENFEKVSLFCLFGSGREFSSIEIPGRLIWQRSAEFISLSIGLSNPDARKK
jgi:hypothetical protein